jgi:CARDB
MRVVRGTKRMGIRFVVFEHRAGQAGYSAVQAPSFGVWLLSKRGVPAFSYVRRINGLDAPATYRVRVGYRWYGKGGKVVKTSSHVTKTCRQFDLRPDLRIGLITVEHGKKGHDRYTVVVRNTGVTAAGPFVLRLSFPGSDVKLWDLPGLAAGASTRRVYAGAPPCADGAPTATADSGAGVDEANEQNNSRVATCPAP